MSIKTSRALAAAMLAGLCVLQVSPAFAQFTGTGSQATNWVVEFLTPVIPLAVAVIGILAWTGRVNWAWFIGAIIGTILFFGRDQVVSMLRGWTGA